MGYTPVQIANMALASFGSTPIQSMSDATPAGSAVALLYPLVTRGLFAEYPWNFAKLTVALNQLAQVPLSDGLLTQGWQNAFALPADLIGLPSRFLANNRYPDRPLLGYEIQNGVVYANQTAIWCAGSFYVDEASWPDYFTPAAVACFAANIYPILTGNGNQQQRLERNAWGAPEEQRCGGLLGSAKRTDSRANPSRKLAQNPLIDVRGYSVSVIPNGSIF